MSPKKEKSTFDYIRSLICGTFHVRAVQVQPHTSFEKDLGFDEADMFVMFREVERSFNLNLSGVCTEAVTHVDNLAVFVDQMRTVHVS